MLVSVWIANLTLPVDPLPRVFDKVYLPTFCCKDLACSTLGNAAEMKLLLVEIGCGITILISKCQQKKKREVFEKKKKKNMNSYLEHSLMRSYLKRRDLLSLNIEFYGK